MGSPLPHLIPFPTKLFINPYHISAIISVRALNPLFMSLTKPPILCVITSVCVFRQGDRDVGFGSIQTSLKSAPVIYEPRGSLHIQELHYIARSRTGLWSFASPPCTPGEKVYRQRRRSNWWIFYLYRVIYRPKIARRYRKLV